MDQHASSHDGRVRPHRLPELGADLVAALSDLQRDDLPRHDQPLATLRAQAPSGTAGARPLLAITWPNLELRTEL